MADSRLDYETPRHKRVAPLAEARPSVGGYVVATFWAGATLLTMLGLFSGALLAFFDAEAGSSTSAAIIMISFWIASLLACVVFRAALRESTEPVS